MLNNNLGIVGNLVNEDSKQITLRIHCNSPYPQIRSYMMKDIKEVKRSKGIRGLSKKALEI
jgi:hypothetical protein